MHLACQASVHRTTWKGKECARHAEIARVFAYRKGHIIVCIKWDKIMHKNSWAPKHQSHRLISPIGVQILWNLEGQRMEGYPLQ